MLDPFAAVASVREELDIPDDFALSFSKTTCFINDQSGVLVCQGNTMAELEANWDTANGR